MPRLAILNMIIGFIIVLFSASAGAFVALEMTQSFLNEPDQINGWFLTLSRSAHGHFNLFGYLHILFGLSLNYSLLSPRAKAVQTEALSLGSIAMGPLMILRAFEEPSMSPTPLAITVGLFLSVALLAIGAHVLGLALKFARA